MPLLSPFICLSNYLNILDRRCTNGKLTYEKTKGYELIKAEPYSPLYIWNYGLQEGWFSTCGRICKSDTKCMGFNMGYNRTECRLFKNSKNNMPYIWKFFGAFFKAICLKGKYVKL